MNQSQYILPETLSEESPRFVKHTDRARWVDRNVLLSRKRKLAALYYCASHATVDSSKYDNQEYCDHERAFLDANDLERSVTSLHTILTTIYQLSSPLQATCG
jgi:hypothetical protein